MENGISVRTVACNQTMKPVAITYIHSSGFEDINIIIEVPRSHKRFKELNEKMEFIKNMTRDQMLDALLDYNPDDYVSVKKEEVKEELADNVVVNKPITW